MTNSGLVALAGLGSALPSSACRSLAIDGNDVAFAGTTSIRVRRSSGVVQLFADNTTPVPGAAGNNFGSFSTMDFHNGTVVFTGSSVGAAGFRTGIYYQSLPGFIFKLVDNDTVAPGGSGSAKFSAFATNSGRFAIHGNDVVFYATVADGRTGIFISRNFGPAHRLITEYDPANPTVIKVGFPERADMVQGLSVSNGEVAFMARSPGNVTGDLRHPQRRDRARDRHGRHSQRSHRRRSLRGNEMRSGNTIAFGVLFVENFFQRGIYRADRGQPAVSNSGMIVNGSFANGLNNWTPAELG